MQDTGAVAALSRGGPLVRNYKEFVRFLRTKPMGAVGVGILTMAALVAILAPWIAPYDPFYQIPELRLTGPTWEHPFGMDLMGRDLLSRVIYGARVSMYVGILGMLLSSLVGAILGISSAYFGGKFDLIVQRFVDVLGERVVEVRESKVLTDHPVRLAAPEGQLDRHVQRVYRLLEQDFEVPRKILEINRRHPLIRNLAAWVQNESDAPLIDQVIEQLYESALLMDGLHPNPASMVGRIEALMEHATRRE